MSKSILWGDMTPADLTLIDRVLAKDANRLAPDCVDKYMSSNRGQYFIAINTWLNLFRQYCPYNWVYVMQHISDNGLLATIDHFSKEADRLVSGLDVNSNLAKNLQIDVYDYIHSNRILDRGQGNIGVDPFTTVLTLFRFLKRFSVVNSSVLHEESLMKFIDTQKWLKKQCHTEVPYRMIQEVRDVIDELHLERVNLEGLDIKAYSSLIDIQGFPIRFSPGSTLEGCKTIGSKFEHMLQVIPDRFYSFLHPVSHKFMWAHNCDFSKELLNDTVNIMCVPKSYKAYRVIAPEKILRQSLSLEFFRRLEAFLPDTIALRDQSVNQYIAKIGSIDGSWATFDETCASDTVRQDVAADVFPKEFIKTVIALMPRYAQVPLSRSKRPRRVLLSCLGTMGNALTFIIESIYFWAIAKAAVRYQNRMLGQPCHDETVFAYGDDVIVRSEYSDIVQDWYEAFSIQVNKDKTFLDPNHLYRESCGSEWYCGVDVSQKLWPRSVIRATVDTKTFKCKAGYSYDTFRGIYTDSTMSLIALHNALYDFAPRASFFLSQIVQANHPNMTHSMNGYMNDLKGPYDDAKVITAPLGTFDEERNLVTRLYTKEDYDNLPEYIFRELHYTPFNSPKLGTDNSSYYGEVTSLYNYVSFLEKGPSYESELDRLLGVSKPPLSPSDLFGEPVIRWGYKAH